MAIQDILVTPIYLVLILILAYLFRPYFTNSQTRKYFLPGLLIKMFGAIMLGLIFEFYYGYGGDTFNYYYEPGIVIANSFFEDPTAWFRLVFFPAEFQPEIYAYTSQIFTYQDPPTYFIARIVGFFGVKSESNPFLRVCVSEIDWVQISIEQENDRFRKTWCTQIAKTCFIERMTFFGCVQGLPAHFLLKTRAKSCSALLFAVMLNAQKITSLMLFI